MTATRDGCCADWPKPCPYHEGWQDSLDAMSGARLVVTVAEARREHRDRSETWGGYVCACGFTTEYGQNYADHRNGAIATAIEQLADGGRS